MLQRLSSLFSIHLQRTGKNETMGNHIIAETLLGNITLKINSSKIIPPQSWS